jgi:hypothetical protein
LFAAAIAESLTGLHWGTTSIAVHGNLRCRRSILEQSIPGRTFLRPHRGTMVPNTRYASSGKQFNEGVHDVSPRLDARNQDEEQKRPPGNMGGLLFKGE